VSVVVFDVVCVEVSCARNAVEVTPASARMVPVSPVGRVTVPVNVGEASGAPPRFDSPVAALLAPVPPSAMATSVPPGA
jgi:hypothetical protein